MISQVSPQPRLLLKPDEAAKVLAISPRTLWSLTHAGVVPCIRLGKSVRYSVDTLRAIVTQRQELQRAKPDARGATDCISSFLDGSAN